MKKPPYISHYLVLLDLINGIDVKEKVDFIYYLCSRIENIKSDLKKEGIEFLDDEYKETAYSRYKLYILAPTKENIDKVKNLLERYGTEEVINFLKNNELKKVDNILKKYTTEDIVKYLTSR